MTREEIVSLLVGSVVMCSLGLMRSAEPSIARNPAAAAANAKSEEQPEGIALQADSRAMGKPLVHFWSTCVGAGRANEGLRKLAGAA